MTRFHLLSAWALILAMCAAPAAAEEEVGVFVYKKISPSVALLKSLEGFGTGFAIDEDGLVVTNAHVISSPLPYQMRVDVLKKDGTIGPMIFKKVKILGLHPKLDMALVQVDAKAAGVKLLPVEISRDQIIPGQSVYAIGNPGGGEGGGALQKTFTEGKVSGVRALEGIPYIQHSASINPGNSGGPLVNSKGQVVGVNTLKSYNEGIGFAIPMDKFKTDVFVKPEERKADPAKLKEIMDYAAKVQDELRRMREVLSKDDPRLVLARAHLFEVYHEALSRDPGSKDLYIKLGSLLHQLEEHMVATAYLARGIELDPWYNNAAYVEFGRSLGKIGKGDMARLAFAEAIAKFPNDSDQTAVDLAKYSAKEKEWSDAAYYAKLAIAIGVIPRQEDELVKIYDNALGKLGAADAEKTKERCDNANTELKAMKSAAVKAKNTKEKFLNKEFESFITDYDAMADKQEEVAKNLWGDDAGETATEGPVATNPSTPTTPTPVTPAADPAKEIADGIELAKQQVSQREKDKAVQTLKALVEKYPDHPDIKKAKSLLAIWDKPAPPVTVKPEKDPTADLIQRKIDLAKIFKRSNQTDKAIETLEKVIEDNPTHPLTETARALLKEYKK